MRNGQLFRLIIQSLDSVFRPEPLTLWRGKRQPTHSTVSEQNPLNVSSQLSHVWFIQREVEQDKKGKKSDKKKLISEQKDRRLSSKYRNDHPKNGGISQLQLSSLNHDGVHDVYGHHFSKSQQPTFITRQSWQPQRSFNAKKKQILAPPGRRLVNCRAAGSRLFDGTTWHQLDLSMLIANIF